jgi:outer membrane lipoprotein SlyB
MHRALAQIGATLAAVALLGLTPAAVAQQQKTTVCSTCGVVESIRFVQEEGKGSGLGMIAGGVVGGVLGHQIGSGRGNTVATIAGAAGGAYAGNAIEKNKNKKAYYAVTVKLDNGKTQTLEMGTQPTAREGERVKILDGNRLALLSK